MTGSATTAQTPFRAGRALAWLAGFGTFGLGISALYATTGYGIGCPFRALTGWECPLCGGTRLGSALLHGDPAAAFAFNPLVFLGLIALAVLGVVWTIDAVGGPRIRPPDVVSARLRLVTPTGWLVLIGVVAVSFTVLRNLL